MRNRRDRHRFIESNRVLRSAEALSAEPRRSHQRYQRLPFFRIGRRQVFVLDECPSKILLLFHRAAQVRPRSRGQRGSAQRHEVFILPPVGLEFVGLRV
jgi:hypothetical protein